MTVVLLHGCEFRCVQFPLFSRKHQVTMVGFNMRGYQFHCQLLEPTFYEHNILSTGVVQRPAIYNAFLKFYFIALSIIVTFLTTVRSLALPWWYVSVRSAICICQEGKAGKFHQQLHQHFRRFQMRSRHYKTNKCFGYTKLNYSIHRYSNASNTGSLCLEYVLPYSLCESILEYSSSFELHYNSRFKACLSIKHEL